LPAPPPPPPGEDIEPPKVKAELERHWNDHHRGWFRVDFSCWDRVDRHPTCVADINGIRVRDGQKVYLVETSGPTRVYRTHGSLFIKAPTFLLTVTGTDDHGNTATATAKPRFKIRKHHRWWS
jgi:hypothetical protein